VGIGAKLDTIESRAAGLRADAQQRDAIAAIPPPWLGAARHRAAWKLPTVACTTAPTRARPALAATALDRTRLFF
jgi:hypothetical protein